MALLSCGQPVFGPIAPTRHALMGIRYVEGEGGGGSGDGDKGGGDDKGSGDKGGSGDEKKFSQTDVDRIVADRIARERKKFGADDDKEKDKEKPDTKSESSSGTLTADDVKKLVDEAVAEERKKLALERAGDALDKALEGRTYSASQVRALDLERFVKDGKTDADALKKWVEDNTEEGPKPRRGDPGQGKRDANATGGTVSAGRDLFDSERKPKQKE